MRTFRSPLTPWLRTLLGLLLAGHFAAAAAQTITYDGCVDAAGLPVRAELDEALPAVARSSVEGGQGVIRYNPAEIPRLKPQTRLFLFAHECARHALGQPLRGARSPERARAADCWAIATLQRSGLLLGPDEVEAIQSDLGFSQPEWRRLTGPRRTIDLAACSRGALLLPAAAPPGEEQMQVNRCIVACGDGLWKCQNSCRGAGCIGACVETNDACEARCRAAR